MELYAGQQLEPGPEAGSPPEMEAVSQSVQILEPEPEPEPEPELEDGLQPVQILEMP